MTLFVVPLLALLLLWLGGLIVWWYPHAKGFSADRDISPTFQDLRLAEALAIIRPGVTPRYSSPDLADERITFKTKGMKEDNVLGWVAFCSKTAIIEDAEGLRVEGMFWLERFYQRLDGHIRLYWNVKIWPTRAYMR